MYVLCHLLGYKEPASIIASYLHLRELAGYLLLNAKATIQNKQLTQTLGRTKVLQRRDCADNLALRLSFETRQQEKVIEPVHFGNDLPPQAPATLHDYVIKASTQSGTSVRSLLTWAVILMGSRTLTPEQIAQNEGVHPDEIRRLISVAETIQKACSGRGKLLPLIPNLTPWVKTLNQKPDDQEKTTKKAKAESHSLKILRFLLTRLTEKLDNGGLTWDMVRRASYILAFVIPGKGFLIRSPSTKKTQSFFELLEKLGLNAKRLQLTLYLDPNQTADTQAQKWFNALKNSPLGPLEHDAGEVGEFDYMKSDYRDTGVLQIALVNRKLSAKGRRQRVFISFFQLLAILSVFFIRAEKTGLA